MLGCPQTKFANNDSKRGSYMRFAKQFVVFNLLIFVILFSGCGGGGGGGTTSDSGTVTLSVTDAKPLLPDNVENFFVSEKIFLQLVHL